ncbi:hypothetical protein QR685DRAFT_451714 [Neurospora intermedia]|uniref:Uncharacterized protein n=1 Tax=Neurospora intermedia TaxID=5142 RepID=A0ABR3D070_NEUIN
MEKDAALPMANHEFVGGRIMWLPKKEVIETGNLEVPALDDKLFDHPVLIISDHREEQTDIVRVLIITTFAKEGLETRFGLSRPCRYYLPLPGAPAHPCSKWSKKVPSNLTFTEENGNEKALRDSWINAKASYLVSYQCLINWKNMQRTPTLTEESLRDVINYHTERVPKIESWDEAAKRSKEEEEKKKEKRIDIIRSRTSWRIPSKHPVSETRGVVSTTTYPPEMSISQSAVMLAKDERRGRSASSDPPRSKSISTLIPNSRSHVSRVVEEGPPKKIFYNKNSPRGIPGEFSAATTSTSHHTPRFLLPILLTCIILAYVSGTWRRPAVHFSANLCQKPLVSAPTEVLGIASFDVLSQDTGYAMPLRERQSVHVWQWFLRPQSTQLSTSLPGPTIKDSHDVHDTPGHPQC